MELVKRKKVYAILILLFGIVCYLMGNVIRIKTINKTSFKINEKFYQIVEDILKDVEITYGDEKYRLDSNKVEFDHERKEKNQSNEQHNINVWISLEKKKNNSQTGENFCIKIPIEKLDEEEYTLDCKWMKKHRGNITGEIEFFSQIINNVENIFYKESMRYDYDLKGNLRVKNTLEISMGEKEIEEILMESEIIDGVDRITFIAEMYEKKDIGFSKVNIKVKKS
ncbi:hypothetical protein [Oceanirhabdus sp. W0125-5]|uniref:hypothetical protein n=1 Tax=Oceanirhabdus sp. W0125-5 TaxID=2999116 RepID=UPI0022F2C5E3|nr:hypothetical protein [Oceanirhabdus sp. W0125-5]WBW96528.1 hypothetical protein OW730_22970 [Oceanirhabdus sp. W0125-5]